MRAVTERIWSKRRAFCTQLLQIMASVNSWKHRPYNTYRSGELSDGSARRTDAIDAFTRKVAGLDVQGLRQELKDLTENTMSEAAGAADSAITEDGLKAVFVKEVLVYKRTEGKTYTNDGWHPFSKKERRSLSARFSASHTAAVKARSGKNGK